MNLEAALTWIFGTNGKIFAIRFAKRGTGELREMACRLGVKKGVTSDAPKDWRASNLIGVYDMVQGYRSIPIEGIRQLKINGEWCNVVHTSN